MATSGGQAGVSLPLAYRLFFLVIEPIATLVGAYYAFYRPEEYLQLTHAETALPVTPLGTKVALSQLANLYLAFALNEAIVLRSTSDLRVWKALLFGLLVADFGHLYTVRALGIRVYYNVWSWNAIDWGNVAFVYCGAAMRISFLTGVGMGNAKMASIKKS